MTAQAIYISLLGVQLKQFVFEKYFCNERTHYEASLLEKA
jgi:hypothetical protein